MTTVNTTANTDATENTEAKKSTRGRKKIDEGGKPSPRQILVSCAAIVDGVLVLEDIHCEDSDKATKDDEVFAEAKRRFEEKYSVAPTNMTNPHFPRKEVGVTRKRDSLNISMEDIVFVADRKATAVYKGWNVSVRFIEDRDDAVYIIYRNHTQEQKKTKPANKAVRFDSLENLVEDPETQVETQASAE
jgi:hypothetical protein